MKIRFQDNNSTIIKSAVWSLFRSREKAIFSIHRGISRRICTPFSESIFEIFWYAKDLLCYLFIIYIQKVIVLILSIAVSERSATKVWSAFRCRRGIPSVVPSSLSASAGRSAGRLRQTSHSPGRRPPSPVRRSVGSV